MSLPSLAPLDMSLQAGDGLILKGTLAYPADAELAPFPLAVLVHQYPATRDSYAPLARDLLARGIAVLAFDLRGHGASTRTIGGQDRLIHTPADFTFPSVVLAFASSASEIGFSRIPDDICRIANWGMLQNFIAGDRLALVGSSVGGTACILAAPSIAPLTVLATLGAAGAPAFGPDGPLRARQVLERLGIPCYMASSHEDVFDGASNVLEWSQGLEHVRRRLVDGDAHAMGIYYDIRDELLETLAQPLGVA